MARMLFYRLLYRPLMRLAHRYHWHYAPEIGPLAPTGEYQRWCHWCGFRQSFRKRPPYDPPDLKGVA